MKGFEIQLNGEARTVSSTTVAALLEELGLADRKVAVELNHVIVSRADYPATALAAGDKLEIIHFVGGG
ncbi:MAG: sulfur carrier protein ThiS [Bdellovibrionota bacterium]